MTYLYLVTALFCVLFGVCTSDNTQSKLVLGVPAFVGAVIYGILAAKGFGLI